MSARLRNIAQHTEKIVEAGRYTGPAGREVSIVAAVAQARDGTRMYGPDPVPLSQPRPPQPASAVLPGSASASASGPGTGGLATARPPVQVTGESSLEAARRLVAERDGQARARGPVAVLNFASARNPGGGFLNGAQAQEEALCRASALYTCLLRAPEYYEHHRAERSAFYSDRVIHSPAVPVFRDDRGELLDEPFAVGFLTSPAPNAGVILRRTPELAHLIPAALLSRAERVLEVAALHGYRRLVLGAWGCGVFRNDPAAVAGAFRTHLNGGRFAGRFDHVVFAVLDRNPDSPARAAFRAAFPERIPS